MNTKNSLKLLIATATLALAGTAAIFADDSTPPAAPSDTAGRPPHRAGGRPPLPPEILAKYDVNKDGKLDETERAALKADVDAGKVSLPKHGPGGPGGPGGKGRPVPPEVLAKYDANKDGKIDATERAKMKADIESGAFVPPHRPHGHPGNPPADDSNAAPAPAPGSADGGTTVVPKRPRN